MEKEFVPYELAVKLKELGFDEECYGAYSTFHQNKWKLNLDFGVKNKWFKKTTEGCSAPTFSQVFRWFREKYRLFHEVFIDTEPSVDEPDKIEFTYLVLHMVGMEKMYTSRNRRFETYEEAELACLTKLIEIVENK